MKNGLTRTQFFWSFIGRKSLIFFWLPLGRLECYSVIIFLGFCIYSVYPRFLRLRCGCLWFFFFWYIWSILELYFDCLCKYGLCILNPLSMKFKWNLKSVLYICNVSSPWCVVLHMFVLHLLFNFVLIFAKIASKTDIRHN